MVLEGLSIDGGHHKQWYLWQMANALGCTDEELSDFEVGIAP